MKSLLSLLLFTLLSVASYSQSKIIGRVDADGNTILLASKQDCTTKIAAAGDKKSKMNVSVSEVLFTRLNKGQICLTGYEKDATGKITKGVRIECSLDDDNNLIIHDNSKIETISGRAFSSPATQSNL